MTKKSKNTYMAMKRAIAEAERRGGDGGEIGGTGLTVLKAELEAALPSLRRLIEDERIGAEELRAADEIILAYHHQTHALAIKPPSMERKDASYNTFEPKMVVDAVERYKAWANFWSHRSTARGDRTLQVVMAAVIERWSFGDIEAKYAPEVHKMKIGFASTVVACGLRDYAARAGWVEKRLALVWTESALGLFPLLN